MTDDDVKQTPLATLYRINIHWESEKSTSGSKRTEHLAASPLKRKTGAPPEAPKISKMLVANLDPSPEKWTPDEHEAWQEHTLKQINHLSEEIVNKMQNNPAFQQGAPEYVKEDTTNLQNYLDDLHNTIRDKNQEDLIAADVVEMSQVTKRYNVLFKSANAFIKAHRAYGTPPKSTLTPAEEPKAKAKGKPRQGQGQGQGGGAGKAKAKAKAKATAKAKAKAKARSDP